MNPLKRYILSVVKEYIESNFKGCTGCCCVVPNAWAKKVTEFSVPTKGQSTTYFYCESCAPDYDIIRDGKYYKTTPAKEVEVKIK